MVDANITIDEMVGLYRCDMTVKLPEMTVTRWKKSRDELRGMQSMRL